MEAMQITRFDEKKEKRVIRALGNFFKKAQEPISEEEAINKENVFLMDTGNVCLIEAKSPEAKICFRDFKDSGYMKEAPKFCYDDMAKYGTGCRFSIDYLSPIINLLKFSDEGSVNIFVVKDYPATFENKHFKVI